MRALFALIAGLLGLTLWSPTAFAAGPGGDADGTTYTVDGGATLTTAMTGEPGLPVSASCKTTYDAWPDAAEVGNGDVVDVGHGSSSQSKSAIDRHFAQRSTATTSLGCDVAAKSAEVVVPQRWNAATKLPSGGTVRDVGNRIWGHGLPSPGRLAGMTDDELRALASLEDARMLNAMYRGAGPSVPNNATAPVRVDLSQLVIDAWSRK